jgi:hypothetical protein
MKNTIKLFMIAAAFFISGNLFAQVHSPAGTPVQATVAPAVDEAQEVPGPTALDIYIKEHQDDADVQNYLYLLEKLTDPNLSSTEIANLQSELTGVTANITAQADKVDMAQQSNNADPVSSHIIQPAIPGNPSTWSTMFMSTGDSQQDAQIIFEWLKLNGIVK